MYTSLRRRILLAVYDMLCQYAACALNASIVMRFMMMSGRLAQMVERPLRMREVGGSIPPVSTLYSDKAIACHARRFTRRTFHQPCSLPLFV